MAQSVLVFGSTCVDVILRLPRLPRTGEDLQPDGQRFQLGGCAYNVANILGRGGADVRLITPVGMSGVYGPYVLAKLRPLSWASPIPLSSRENGCCYCLVESGGERTFLSVHGAEYSFQQEWMESWRSDWAYLYICGLEAAEPTGGALVSWLETRPARHLFYAPGPRLSAIDPALQRRILDLGPMLHLNASEACQLAKVHQVEMAARVLHQRTGEAVFVTLGAEGVLVADQGKLQHVPGVPVDCVVDTIGAGDAHAGAVLLGLTRGLRPSDSAALANQVAAAVTMCQGATLPQGQLEHMLANCFAR